MPRSQRRVQLNIEGIEWLTKDAELVAARDVPKKTENTMKELSAEPALIIGINSNKPREELEVERTVVRAKRVVLK